MGLRIFLKETILPLLNSILNFLDKRLSLICTLALMGAAAWLIYIATSALMNGEYSWENAAKIGNASQLISNLLAIFSVGFLFYTLREQHKSTVTQNMLLEHSQNDFKEKLHTAARQEILEYISESQAVKRTFAFKYDDLPIESNIIENKEKDEKGTKENECQPDEIVTENISESYDEGNGQIRKTDKTVIKKVRREDAKCECGREKTYRGHQIFDRMYIDLGEICNLLAAKSCNSDKKVNKLLSQRLRNRLDSYGDMCDIILPLAMKYRYITKRIENSQFLEEAEKQELEELLSESLTRNELRILGFIYSNEMYRTTNWVRQHSIESENEKNLKRCYSIYFQDNDLDLLGCMIHNIPTEASHNSVNLLLREHFKKCANFLADDIDYFCKMYNTSDEGN